MANMQLTPWPNGSTMEMTPKTSNIEEEAVAVEMDLEEEDVVILREPVQVEILPKTSSETCAGIVGKRTIIGRIVLMRKEIRLKVSFIPRVGGEQVSVEEEEEVEEDPDLELEQSTNKMMDKNNMSQWNHCNNLHQIRPLTNNSNHLEWIVWRP